MQTSVQSQAVSIQPQVIVAAQPQRNEKIHRVQLRNFLFSQKGKIMTVGFIKKNGERRVLNGRLGVRKHLKGGESTLSGSDLPYLVVFDVKKSGYRALNLATVDLVKANGREYLIEG